MFKSKINKIYNQVPLGDKGVPGERDDMFNPQMVNIGDRYRHLQRYRYAAKKIGNNRKVLDLGCGTGYGTKILSNERNEVYGIDISQKAVDYAKKTYFGPRYTCSSAERLPFKDNDFDVITAFEVIEHIENPEKALAEIYRVLKNDGSLFISTPNLRHLGNMLGHFLLGRPYPKHSKNIYHLKEFYYDEFVNFLKNAGFKIVFQYGQELRPWPWKVQLILEKILPFLIIYKLQTLLGYYFPRYSTVIVFQVKK